MRIIRVNFFVLLCLERNRNASEIVEHCGWSKIIFSPFYYLKILFYLESYFDFFLFFLSICVVSFGFYFWFMWGFYKESELLAYHFHDP